MPHIPSFAGSPLIPPPLYTIVLSVGFVLLLVFIFLIIHFQNKRFSFKHKLKEFLVWSGFLLAGILGVSSYIFLTTPKIVSATPANTTVDPNSKISVTFDKPVGRKSISETITPEVPGTWVYEDPVYSTHLYRKLTFYPDTTLNPGTNYSIELSGIENTAGTTKPYSYGFSFSTRSNPVISQAVQKFVSQTVKLPVPSYLQQHTLSCEVSSLRMALAYKGITKSEDELLAQVGVDNTPHIDGTWGNPYEHFVGNVNGNQLRDGYGVYWDPIERVAKMYGNAQAFQNGSISLLTSNIQKGNPVIVWVYSESGAPTHWKTPSGIDVFAVAGEHTVVVVGYVGPADNPTEIIVNDSLVGQSYWPRSFFDHKWATFSQAGVIIFK